MRSYKVGQGEGQITGSQNVKPSTSEQIAFKLFAKAATNGTIWKQAFAQAHIVNPVVKAFAPALPVAKDWDAYKQLPDVSGNFYKKVQKIEGVKYE